MRDCVCAQSLSRVPLGNPMHASLPAPLSMGFPRQEYLSGLPCPLSGDLPHPGIKPMLLEAPELQADSLLLSHLGSLLYDYKRRMNIHFMAPKLVSFIVI